MPDMSARSKLMEFPEMKEKYDLEYPDYKPDPVVLQQLKPLLENKEIIIVMGVWCSDSRLQVPHFYKILDESGVEEKTITLICVDEMKKSANGLTENLSIEKVPTFILTAHRKEIGRITEWPEATLEIDMVEILKQ
ncbi:thioredoxin [Pedobacter cryoconitis]|uniref:Thioredoxin n=1 Tax=Pedobacter cryoconitis TaxID=188932 RepID=A0A7X0MLI6_9SPHI|nr:thioredoxin [Pedobacter cryoconitis]MBB6501875.1 hypothetical protein [Pedobacter cryoconitis]